MINKNFFLPEAPSCWAAGEQAAGESTQAPWALGGSVSYSSPQRMLTAVAIAINALYEFIIGLFMGLVLLPYNVAHALAKLPLLLSLSQEITSSKLLLISVYSLLLCIFSVLFPLYVAVKNLSDVVCPPRELTAAEAEPLRMYFSPNVVSGISPERNWPDAVLIFR